MIIDSSLEMADAALITNAVAANVKKGDAINLHPLIADNATVDFSAGEQMFFVLEVTTAFVGSGASVNILLTTATDEALTGTPITIWETTVLGVGSFPVGTRWKISLPKADYKQWLGLRVTTSGATTTAGAVNAFLTKDVNQWTSTNTRVNV